MGLTNGELLRTLEKQMCPELQDVNFWNMSRHQWARLQRIHWQKYIHKSVWNWQKMTWQSTYQKLSLQMNFVLLLMGRMARAKMSHKEMRLSSKIEMLTRSKRYQDLGWYCWSVEIPERIKMTADSYIAFLR